jgi:hypothetical protein
LQDNLINLSHKSYPDVNEIRASYLVASQRFENQKSKKSNKDSMATVNVNASQLKTDSVSKINKNSISKNKFSCSFCSSTEHKNAKCSKYSTPKSKNDRIRELNICFLCFKNGHASRTCTFKLNNNCYKCSRKHWGYLCEAVASQPSKSTVENVPNSKASSTVSSSNTAQVDADANSSPA